MTFLQCHNEACRRCGLTEAEIKERVRFANSVSPHVVPVLDIDVPEAEELILELVKLHQRISAKDCEEFVRQRLNLN